MPIGTARIASLCLPNSELHWGVRFGELPAFRRALSNPELPAALLFPGEGATDLALNPPPRPITLVVVDGTWWQAKKVLRENPELRALPRYAFAPATPSEYRIRREPADDHVSTIEALVHALGFLEGDPARFEPLLAPFRAMVERQLAFARNIAAVRTRHAAMRERHERKPRIVSLLADRAADVVCAFGEVNAWPHRSAERERCGEELVHWVARRMGTGETFEAVVKASHLAPRTPEHIGIPLEALEHGEARGSFVERWRAFVRDTDLMCTWGPYPVRLLAQAGAVVPKTQIDVRKIARDDTTLGSPRRGRKESVGSISEFVAGIGKVASAPVAQGRAGLRVAELLEVARHFGSRVR